MSDFWTMVWKETRDSILSERRSGWIIPLMVLAIMGIVVPWQFGQNWIALSPSPIFIVSYIPFFLTTSYIGDAVAGERERHTLETLLATRISDWASLWGKITVAIAYSLGLTLIGLVIGLVVANLSSGQGLWEFYHPIQLLLEMLALSLLASVLSASGGVLISLRAATVRQAQQTMAVGTLALLIAIVLILKSAPASVIEALDASQILLFFIGGFALLDLILIGILSASFQRSRLILS
jgi:ABC-2 type transport system permease protein